jgi:hypothetical protein
MTWSRATRRQRRDAVAKVQPALHQHEAAAVGRQRRRPGLVAGRVLDAVPVAGEVVALAVAEQRQRLHQFGMRVQRVDQRIGLVEGLAGVVRRHQRPDIELRRRHREAAALQAFERPQPRQVGAHRRGQRRADADHRARLVQRLQRAPQRDRVAALAPLQRHRGRGSAPRAGCLRETGSDIYGAPGLADLRNHRGSRHPRRPP